MLEIVRSFLNNKNLKETFLRFMSVTRIIHKVRKVMTIHYNSFYTIIVCHFELYVRGMNEFFCSSNLLTILLKGADKFRSKVWPRGHLQSYERFLCYKTSWVNSVFGKSDLVLVVFWKVLMVLIGTSQISRASSILTGHRSSLKQFSIIKHIPAQT